jgi:hypothetical protein
MRLDSMRSKEFYPTAGQIEEAPVGASSIHQQ